MNDVIDLDEVRLARRLAERDKRLSPEEIAERNMWDELDWHEPADDNDD